MADSDPWVAAVDEALERYEAQESGPTLKQVIVDGLVAQGASGTRHGDHVLLVGSFDVGQLATYIRRHYPDLTGGHHG